MNFLFICEFFIFFLFYKFVLEIFTLFLYYIVLIASNELSIKPFCQLIFHRTFILLTTSIYIKLQKLGGKS